ncbi:MAG: CBS domain-containing protein [Candidatus Methylarchaceae archaeon HK02M1]|nr:CBS domain-containing protein [Candidatus Methylarchaceae archaeon HK02M1]
MKLVKDLMTVKVISFRPSDKLSKVAETFAKLGISGAPVVDDQNRVIGVISERDIIELIKSKSGIKERTEGMLTETLQFFHIYPVVSIEFRRTMKELDLEEKFWKEIEDGKVEDIMTKKPLTVSEKEGIDKSIELMVVKGVNRVPVITEEGELVGIITRADIIQSFSQSVEEN